MRNACCAVAAVLFVLSACTERKEVARFVAPDSAVDAIVVESDCGAPCSTTYSIGVVPRGKAPDEKGAVFSADHVDSLRVHWLEAKRLEIAYDSARIHHFSNYWQSKDVQDHRYVVEVRVAPRSTVWSLSAQDRWMDSLSRSLPAR